MTSLDNNHEKEMNLSRRERDWTDKRVKQSSHINNLYINKSNPNKILNLGKSTLLNEINNLPTKETNFDIINEPFSFAAKLDELNKNNLNNHFDFINDPSNRVVYDNIDINKIMNEKRKANINPNPKKEKVDADFQENKSNYFSKYYSPKPDKRVYYEDRAKITPRIPNNKVDQSKSNIIFGNSEMNINSDLNVKSNLQNKGVINEMLSLTPFDLNNRIEVLNRKKAVLENFENQINLNNNCKLGELNRKKNEDKKYLNGLNNYYPFGRGGAGAPNRDKFGNPVVVRKQLISDPKYQHININNIIDDYHEVRKGNQINNQNGNINFLQNPTNTSNPITFGGSSIQEQNSSSQNIKYFNNLDNDTNEFYDQNMYPNGNSKSVQNLNNNSNSNNIDPIYNEFSQYKRDFQMNRVYNNESQDNEYYNNVNNQNYFQDVPNFGQVDYQQPNNFQQKDTKGNNYAQQANGLLQQALAYNNMNFQNSPNHTPNNNFLKPNINFNNYPQPRDIQNGNNNNFQQNLLNNNTPIHPQQQPYNQQQFNQQPYNQQPYNQQPFIMQQQPFNNNQPYNQQYLPQQQQPYTGSQQLQNNNDYPQENNNFQGNPNGINNTTNPANYNNMDINITYKNFEVDESNKQKQKQDYANYLMQQIESKKNKKKLEKEKKEKEELEEENRLKKEREILQLQFENEKKRIKPN